MNNEFTTKSLKNTSLRGTKQSHAISNLHVKISSLSLQGQITSFRSGHNNDIAEVNLQE